MFNWFKSKNNFDSQVLKTREGKLIEKENEEKKMICPNCGRHPEGGKYHYGIVLGVYHRWNIFIYNLYAL